MRETGGVTTYIGFLRAVNVGKRQVKMERLRACLTAAGFDNVRTYIASGNLFIDDSAKPTAARAAKLTAELESVMEAEFGFEIPTMLRTVAQVEAVVARKSFKDITLTEDMRLLVTFLASAPRKVDLPFSTPDGGIAVIDATEGEIFSVITLINGKWPNNFKPVEKAFGSATGTARFAHTLEKILAAAKT